jgi:hypothetical protein
LILVKPDISSGDEARDTLRSAALNTSVAVSSVFLGAHVGGEFGAALAAGIPTTLSPFIEHMRSLRTRRAELVFIESTRLTGLTIEELIERLESDALRGELATRVLLAAQDAGTEEHLRALCVSLSRGAIGEDSESINAELLYVRATAAIDSSHIMLLDKFTRTFNELHLSEDDTLPPDGLKFWQVAKVSDLGEALNPVLGTLLNHGLLDERQTTGGGGLYVNGRPTRGRFQITNFGLSLIDRMSAIGSAEFGETQDFIAQSEDRRGIDSLLCLVAPCENLADWSEGFAVGPWVSRPDPDSDNGSKLVHAPLCLKHKGSLMNQRLSVGFCQSCQRLGQSNTRCFCGAAFIRAD